MLINLFFFFFFAVEFSRNDFSLIAMDLLLNQFIETLAAEYAQFKRILQFFTGLHTQKVARS